VQYRYNVQALQIPNNWNTKGVALIALLTLLLSVMLNSIYFTWSYYHYFELFWITTLITAVGLAVNYGICRWIGQLIIARFGREDQIMLRLGFMIGVFIMVTMLMQFFVFKSYEVLPFVNMPLEDTRLAWVLLSVAIVDISLVFFVEGISRFRSWQASQAESRTLNESYRQSQLKALKSQVSPHFLFNGLNTLSSLIEEDEEQAEVFLNELSKVYNYILRSDNDQLVPLESELRFLRSYAYVLAARFGDGLKIDVQVQEEDKQRLIAPLILQVITENAFGQNIVSRQSPLVIELTSQDGLLCVRHNLQPKTITNKEVIDDALDAIVRKYQFMGETMAVQETSANQRMICIPLFESNREVSA
jgi:two-component system, LytTR family, sensor kinase